MVLAGILPETLNKGMLMSSRTGCLFRPKPTSERNGYGERLYRLLYVKYGNTSSERWTRDELQAHGATIVEEETG